MDSRVVILDTSVYPYRNEVIVELTGKDRDGDFVVISYQFEYNSESVVSSKEPVEDAFESLVGDALSENGFQWLRSE